MAERLTIGIFPSADPESLSQAIGTQSALDANQLRVVTSSAPSRAHADAPFDFIHVAAAQNDNSLSDTMTHGVGIMSDSGGTTVPGIGGSTASFSAFASVAAADYLAELGIPDDEVDNFNDAISGGRSVVVYPSADGNVAEALRAAGLLHVRTY